MTDRNDYDVGYGRPPKASQFKKGRSGNPKGRPRGSNNLSSDVKRILNTRIPVSEGGRTRKVSTQMASLLRLRDKALRGEPRALDRVIALAAEYNNEELLQDNTSPPSDNDEAILADYFARHVVVPDDPGIGGKESVARASGKRRPKKRRMRPLPVAITRLPTEGK